ncbi:MAG: element excision factor XisI family protein [Bacteroidota bacterium]
MDKMNRNLDIIKSYFREVLDYLPSNADGLKTYLLVDDGHFVLLNHGHHNGKWYHAVLVHVELKNNGEVWLLKDNTDLDVGNEIIKRGLNQEELILGWLDEKTREAMKLMGYTA